MISPGLFGSSADTGRQMETLLCVCGPCQWLERGVRRNETDALEKLVLRRLDEVERLGIRHGPRLVPPCQLSKEHQQGKALTLGQS